MTFCILIIIILQQLQNILQNKVSTWPDIVEFIFSHTLAHTYSTQTQCVFYTYNLEYRSILDKMKDTDFQK